MLQGITMVVYLVVRIEDVEGVITVDPVAVYSNVEKAIEASELLEELDLDIPAHAAPVEKKNKASVMYDVLEYKVDEKPALIQILEQQRDRLQEEINDQLVNLMKSNLIDQLIGEDGNFYYELTSRGKDALKQMQDTDDIEVIKKFLGDFDE